MIERADTPLVSALHPSPSFGPRLGAGADGADMLIMHYTGMHSCAKAIEWLAQPDSNVSCHYVIDCDGTITQMVAEGQRAWHAGRAFWAGETDINSRSIGIEIHNPGHELGSPDFPEAQMIAVEALAQDIVKRNGMVARRVLGHSDVAPQRKGDPGEKFDWRRLARAGAGHWIEPAPVDELDAGTGGEAVDEASRAAAGNAVAESRRLLSCIGYEIDQAGVFDERLQKVLLAFQRHFRPLRCDGRLDHATLETMRKLAASLPAGLAG